MITKDDTSVLDMLTDDDLATYLHHHRGWRMELILTPHGDACMHSLRSGWTTLPASRRVA